MKKQMFFNIICNMVFAAHFSLIQDVQIENNTNIFNNLSPVVYKQENFIKSTFTYNKVPTKLIKIDKKSN